MSQTRREVVFSGREEGLSTTMQSIREQANDTARTLIEQSRETGRSAQQTLDYYDQQIKALERRNRVITRSSRIEIAARRDAALQALNDKEVINPKEFERRRDKIDKRAEEEVADVRNEITKEEKKVIVNQIKSEGGSQEQVKDRLSKLDDRKVIDVDDREERVYAIQQKAEEDKKNLNDSTIAPIDKTFEERKIADRFKEETEDQKKSDAENSLQLEVLKEILAAIKTTSRQEISNDEYQNAKSSNNLSLKILSDNQEALNLAQQLAEQNPNPVPQPNPQPNPEPKGSVSGFNILEQGRKFINTESPVDAAGAGVNMLGLAKNPYALAALAIGGTIYGGMSAKASREMSSSELAALTSRKSEDIASSEIGSSNYGESRTPLDYNVTRDEFTSKYMPQAIRSAGTTENAEERAIQQIEIDKGLGLNQGTGSQLEKLIRISGESSAQTLAATIYSALKESGEMGEDGNDLSKLNEYMRGFIQMSEQAFMRFGVTENRGTIGAMKEVSQLGGNFDREDYTMDTVRSLNEGLVSGGSPESQAIKFDMLRRNNPEKSFFELQAEMEKGVNSENYAKSLMDFVKSSTQDQSTQAVLFDQLTGGQMRKSDILSFLKGDVSFEGLNKDQNVENPNIAKRAVDVASRNQTNLDFMKEGLKDMASSIGNLTDEVKGIRSDVKGATELIKTMD